MTLEDTHACCGLTLVALCGASSLILTLTLVGDPHHTLCPHAVSLVRTPKRSPKPRKFIFEFREKARTLVCLQITSFTILASHGRYGGWSQMTRYRPHPTLSPHNKPNPNPRHTCVGPNSSARTPQIPRSTMPCRFSECKQCMCVLQGHGWSCYGLS